MRRKNDREAPADKSKGEVVKVPIDTTSEAVLLGAVVNDPELRRQYLPLPPEFFFGSGHAAMWRALRELFRLGHEYSSSAVLLVDAEVEVETLESYVRTYREKPPNVRLHVERVRWNRAKKEAADGSVARFIEAFRDAASSPTKVKQAADALAASFSGHGDMRYLRSSHEIVVEHAKELRARRAGERVYRYGLPGLDLFGPNDFREVKEDYSDGTHRMVRQSLDGKPRMVPGPRPGDLTIVTGVSGGGKTTAMTRMILNMIYEQPPRRVLWGAWEQQDGPSLELLASFSLGLSRTHIMTGHFSDQDERDLLEAMEHLGSRVRFFDLPFGRDPDQERRYNRENLNVIHQHLAESGCDVFVMDLFTDALEETDPQEEAKALVRIKQMAIDCRCHIFLLHWLRHKGLAEREDKRPTADLMTGSGAYLGKSDNVLAFHRPGLYSGADDRLECHVLKQRNGPYPLAIEFDWDGEYGEILNGRTLELAKPGDRGGMDDFLGDAKSPPRQGRRKRY